MNGNSVNMFWMRGCLGTCIAFPLLLGGCQRTAPDLPVPSSSIEVKSGAAGTIGVKSKAARFEISQAGNIQCEFPDGAKRLLLDDAQGTPAETLVVGGHEITDWALNPASIKISSATGPTGKLGKRVEEASTSSSSGLEKHQIIEFYDDFPTVAFSTVSYKNVGARTVQLEKVVSQRHRLNAALNDTNVLP